MDGIFYFLFGWLIGSGSGEQVVDGVTAVPDAGMQLASDCMDSVMSSPWLIVPFFAFIFSLAVSVFIRSMD